MMDRHDLRETAALALSVLDLTNLRADCSEDDVIELCARAQTGYGNAAAICILPRYVSLARSILGPSHAVRIATVVNFPDGENTCVAVEDETRAVLDAGADEIDLVIPYRALMAGDEKAVTRMVAGVKAICGSDAMLKTILETGILGDPHLIRRAAELAIAAGTDFIKTSTGRAGVHATQEAVDTILQAIRYCGRKVGIKPSGGMRSVENSGLYLGLAQTVMGEDWVMPSTFRFGATVLLDDILSVLSGRRFDDASMQANH
jgi:deoxyribose-phosphate aldolase